ncbi:MAG: guanylate kinase [Micrococcaceae bacterium]
MKQIPLTVIAGPTAVGKGTVTHKLLQEYPQVELTTSATTREPRPGEVNGKDYYFLSMDEFNQKIKNHEFLEWAVVHKENKYGTLISEIERIRQDGGYPMLEIDLAGARQIREKDPDAITIFLSPPSWEELVKRLHGRGTESEEEMQRRLETARNELKAKVEFEHEVVNDSVENAVNQIAQLMGLQKS